MLNIYITSTERKEGKTYVAAGLAATMQSLGYSTAVYKPIQTCGIERNGFTQSPDLTYIKTLDPYINTHFSYLFKEETEPVIAAEEENEAINVDYIINEYKRIKAISECTILDGNCGILSPIAPNTSVIDMIKRLNIPLIIVTTPNENSVNNTLLTIQAAQEKGVTVNGIIINKISENCPKSLLTSIPRIVEEYSNVKILGLMSELPLKSSPEDIITATLNGIDIESVFNVKIEKLGIN